MQLLSRQTAITLVSALIVIGSSLWTPTSRKLGRMEPGNLVSDCAKCSPKCRSWTDKCVTGSQYACYKGAACLCKCNLDEGGCGSEKDALRECYEKNEKLAKDLGL